MADDYKIEGGFIVEYDRYQDNGDYSPEWVHDIIFVPETDIVEYYEEKNLKVFRIVKAEEINVLELPEVIQRKKAIEEMYAKERARRSAAERREKLQREKEEREYYETLKKKYDPAGG
jgi:hypothetical protein